MEGLTLLLTFCGHDLQWGVFPLMDNYAVDDYYYLLTVHTGLRKGAGTKSKVSFCMAGSLEETGVRVLSDGVREVGTLSSCLILGMLHRSTV